MDERREKKGEEKVLREGERDEERLPAFYLFLPFLLSQSQRKEKKGGGGERGNLRPSPDSLTFSKGWRHRIKKTEGRRR